MPNEKNLFLVFLSLFLLTIAAAAATATAVAVVAKATIGTRTDDMQMLSNLIF